MNKIVITRDSGIDPIDETNMISYQIIRDNRDSFKDLIEINNEQIIKELKEGHKFKTASPILSDYHETFENILENGNDVLHLALGSGISEGGVNASNLIASSLNAEYDNKVYVIDTMNGATGGTLIDEYAKTLVNKGLSIKEIVSELNNFKHRIETSFYVPNPAGFIGSGRDKTELCTKEKVLLNGAKLATKVGLKFRVNINSEGNLYSESFMRAKTNIGMFKMLKSIINEETIESYDPSYAVIGNVLEKDVNMTEVKEYIEGFKYFDKVINKSINGVVAAYGSEDLCGISLIKKI